MQFMNQTDRERSVVRNAVLNQICSGFVIAKNVNQFFWVLVSGTSVDKVDYKAMLY